MTITLTYTWWTVPAVITILGLLWVVFWPSNEGGYLAGMVFFFRLIPVLLVACIAWAIAGFFK